jgi:DNA-binding GntR family transcriptional regulator
LAVAPRFLLARLAPPRADAVEAVVERNDDPRRYRQIADDVRELITSGQIACGQPSPTITELVARYGAARQTAGKALRLLSEEGILARYPGFGYYVTGPRQD